MTIRTKNYHFDVDKDVQMYILAQKRTILEFVLARKDIWSVGQVVSVLDFPSLSQWFNSHSEH